MAVVVVELPVSHRTAARSRRVEEAARFTIVRTFHSLSTERTTRPPWHDAAELGQYRGVIGDVAEGSPYERTASKDPVRERHARRVRHQDRTPRSSSLTFALRTSPRETSMPTVQPAISATARVWTRAAAQVEDPPRQSGTRSIRSSA